MKLGINALEKEPLPRLLRSFCVPALFSSLVTAVTTSWISCS